MYVLSIRSISLQTLRVLPGIWYTRVSPEDPTKCDTELRSRIDLHQLNQTLAQLLLSFLRALPRFYLVSSLHLYGAAGEQSSAYIHTMLLVRLFLPCVRLASIIYNSPLLALLLSRSCMSPL